MIFAGVDPGLTGCVAFLAPDDITFVDLPTVAVSNKGKRDYDVSAMVDIFRSFPPDRTMVALELVDPIPKFTKVTCGSMGRCRGLWEGILATLGIPIELVRPRAWKAAMMPGMPKEKSASILAAKRLFPQVADRLTLAKHHGRSDALMLAAYLQRRHNGGTQ